ncbi:MAG TPA: septal ring lytic transglycosylase RlpA family protein [Solirubrobacteraceae bacterium]|jgi:rare lipoprotein A|nr:septal ring lytic transglycosylase RlpA family protein [Solirubrobacteraceae bacterium]
MFAPAQSAQPAAALAPVQIAATSTPSLGALSLGPRRSSTLHVRRASINVLADSQVSIAGTLSPRLSGRTVTLQALGARGWHNIARARTGTGGRFRVRYVPRQTGSERVRIRFAGDSGEQPSYRRLGQLNVYRVAEASWYGGGGSLACGGSLTSSTLGVANKTLPCGTFVTLRYDNRSIRVPVIDRGPYVAGREFDLTEATKYALGFGDTGAVWSTR